VPTAPSPVLPNKGLQYSSPIARRLEDPPSPGVPLPRPPPSPGDMLAVNETFIPSPQVPQLLKRPSSLHRHSIAPRHSTSSSSLGRSVTVLPTAQPPSLPLAHRPVTSARSLVSSPPSPIEDALRSSVTQETIRPTEPPPPVHRPPSDARGRPVTSHSAPPSTSTSTLSPSASAFSAVPSAQSAPASSSAADHLASSHPLATAAVTSAAAADATSARQHEQLVELALAQCRAGLPPAVLETRLRALLQPLAAAAAASAPTPPLPPPPPSANAARGPAPQSSHMSARRPSSMSAATPPLPRPPPAPPSGRGNAQGETSAAVASSNDHRPSFTTASAGGDAANAVSSHAEAWALAPSPHESQQQQPPPQCKQQVRFEQPTQQYSERIQAPLVLEQDEAARRPPRHYVERGTLQPNQQQQMRRPVASGEQPRQPGPQGEEGLDKHRAEYTWEGKYHAERAFRCGMLHGDRLERSSPFFANFLRPPRVACAHATLLSNYMDLRLSVDGSTSARVCGGLYSLPTGASGTLSLVASGTPSSSHSSGREQGSVQSAHGPPFRTVAEAALQSLIAARRALPDTQPSMAAPAPVGAVAGITQTARSTSPRWVTAPPRATAAAAPTLVTQLPPPPPLPPPSSTSAVPPPPPHLPAATYALASAGPPDQRHSMFFPAHGTAPTPHANRPTSSAVPAPSTPGDAAATGSGTTLSTVRVLPTSAISSHSSLDATPSPPPMGTSFNTTVTTTTARQASRDGNGDYGVNADPIAGSSADIPGGVAETNPHLLVQRELAHQEAQLRALLLRRRAAPPPTCPIGAARTPAAAPPAPSSHRAGPLFSDIRRPTSTRRRRFHVPRAPTAAVATAAADAALLVRCRPQTRLPPPAPTSTPRPSTAPTTSTPRRHLTQPAPGSTASSRRSVSRGHSNVCGTTSGRPPASARVLRRSGGGGGEMVPYSPAREAAMRRYKAQLRALVQARRRRQALSSPPPPPLFPPRCPSSTRRAALAAAAQSTWDDDIPRTPQHARRHRSGSVTARSRGSGCAPSPAPRRRIFDYLDDVHLPCGPGAAAASPPRLSSSPSATARAALLTPRTPPPFTPGSSVAGVHVRFASGRLDVGEGLVMAPGTPSRHSTVRPFAASPSRPGLSPQRWASPGHQGITTTQSVENPRFAALRAPVPPQFASFSPPLSRFQR